MAAAAGDVPVEAPRGGDWRGLHSGLLAGDGLAHIMIEEGSMDFHFFLGIGLVLLLSGLCYFYRKENK